MHHILSSLMHHASTQPNKNAVYVLNSSDINRIDRQINYQELLRAVSQLAERIQSKTKPGDRVMLCYPTGIDFIIAFYACLWARVIAVAVIVPASSGLLKKFQSIYLDCAPSLLLTDKKTQDLYSDSFNLDNLLVMISDLIPPNSGEDRVSCELPEINSNDLAFLQYTSGSITDPKGVMISHANLLHQLQTMAKAFNSQKEWVGVNWLPHTHDMGLIGSFLHSVYQGAEIYLMSPMTVLRRPFSWLQALSKYGAHMTGGPCFMLKMCLDLLDVDKIKTLDLSTLKYMVVGAEPINADIVRDFFSRLALAGLSEHAFAAAYGLAEATLMVAMRSGLKTMSVPEGMHKMHKTAVSCGTTYQNVRIVCLNTGRSSLENEIGELWINSLSLAQGYWSNEEATQESFQAYLDKEAYFKSGDLGFLNQGELYVVGRIKESFIINGFNYYPQDIEQGVLSCDEALLQASCAVFRWRPEESAFMDQFIILIRTGKPYAPEVQEALKIKIKKHILKEYQLIPYDVQFVQFGLPKTTSGKLQRHACIPLYLEHCKQKSVLL